MKLRYFPLLLLSILHETTFHQCQSLASGCSKTLGVASGEIKDDQIKASSYYGENYPRFARLNGNSSWCVAAPDNNSYEYLEIDLKRVVRLTMLRIQRYDERYITKYTIQYKRHKNKKNWRTVVERLPNNTTKTWSFYGNSNRTLRPRLTKLKGSRIVRYVRIVPLEGVGKQWCLRLELYGCEWEKKDGLISYRSEQGSIRGENKTEVVMKDATYDGAATYLGRRQGILQGGLGQLTDGDIGGNAFWYNLKYGKGFEWVGWFDTENPTPSILFEFDTARKFSKILFHANNRPGNVKIFRSLIVAFSMDGVYFSRKFVFTPSKSLRQKRNQSMWVDVDLKGHVGKYLNCEFTYEGKWIVFSEISFESVPSLIDITSQVTELTQTTSKPLTSSRWTRIGETATSLSPVQRSRNKKATILSMPAIIGMAIVGFALIVITIILIIWLRRRHGRVNDRPHQTGNNTRINNPIIQKSASKIKLEPCSNLSDSDEDIDDMVLQKTNNFVPKSQPWYKSLDQHKMNNMSGLKAWMTKYEDSDEDELEKKINV